MIFPSEKLKPFQIEPRSFRVTRVLHGNVIIPPQLRGTVFLRLVVLVKLYKAEVLFPSKENKIVCLILSEHAVS